MKTAGDTQLQWSTYRKWHLAYQMVTCPLMSRDPERSRSSPQHVWGLLSQKRLEIESFTMERLK